MLIWTRVTAVLGFGTLVLTGAGVWNRSWQLGWEALAVASAGGLVSGIATFRMLRSLGRSNPPAVSRTEALALCLGGLCGILAIWPWGLLLFWVVRLHGMH